MNIVPNQNGKVATGGNAGRLQFRCCENKIEKFTKF